MGRIYRPSPMESYRAMQAAGGSPTFGGGGVGNWESVIAEDAPQSWWRANETGAATTLVDSGTYATNGIGLGTTPTWEVSSVAGQKGLNSSGGNIYWYLTGLVPWLYTNDFTFECLMIQAAAPVASRYMATQYNSGASYGGWLFGVAASTGYPLIGGKSWGSGTYRGATGNVNVCDNSWHLLTARISGNVMSIFVDGVETTYGTKQDLSGGSTYPQTSSAHYSMGAYRLTNGTTTGYWLSGLDEIQMYNTALTDARILAHAQSLGLAA